MELKPCKFYPPNEEPFCDAGLKDNTDGCGPCTEEVQRKKYDKSQEGKNELTFWFTVGFCVGVGMLIMVIGGLCYHYLF